jgi:sigma-E factor negative regulatory protein RseC
VLEEAGQVVDVEGEFAWVESERTTTCGGCVVRKGCGTAAIAKVLGNKRLRLRVINRIGAGVGDHVVIGISESGLLRGSLAVYAGPLAGLFAGGLAGHFLGTYLESIYADGFAIAGALAGFVSGLVWLQHFSRVTATDAAFQPVLLRRELRLPTGTI